MYLMCLVLMLISLNWRKYKNSLVNARKLVKCLLFFKNAKNVNCAWKWTLKCNIEVKYRSSSLTLQYSSFFVFITVLKFPLINEISVKLRARNIIQLSRYLNCHKVQPVALSKEFKEKIPSLFSLWDTLC